VRDTARAPRVRSLFGNIRYRAVPTAGDAFWRCRGPNATRHINTSWRRRRRRRRVNTADESVRSNYTRLGSEHTRRRHDVKAFRTGRKRSGTAASGRHCTTFLSTNSDLRGTSFADGLERLNRYCRPERIKTRSIVSDDGVNERPVRMGRRACRTTLRVIRVVRYWCVRARSRFVSGSDFERTVKNDNELRNVSIIRYRTRVQQTNAFTYTTVRTVSPKTRN